MDPRIALLEDDLDEPGLVSLVRDPTAVGVPARAVMCFFEEVLEKVSGRPDVEVATVMKSAFRGRPMYRIPTPEGPVAAFHPGIWAPVAASFFEEAIHLGCRTVVAVGGAGALTPDLALGDVILVDGAVRDEGTSFHYLAPSRVVEAEAQVIAAAEATLGGLGVPFRRGRTWTTDAIYRETRSRVARRVREGCLTVDMEAAAFLAVAKFHGVTFAHLLYAGDTLAGQAWDHRDWLTAGQVRERMFWLAVDVVKHLDRENMCSS